MSPWEMGNVIEKMKAVAPHQFLLCERGFSFGYNNLVADMRGLAIMRAFAPVVFDSTHTVQLPGGQGTAAGAGRPAKRAAFGSLFSGNQFNAGQINLGNQFNTSQLNAGKKSLTLDPASRNRWGDPLPVIQHRLDAATQARAGATRDHVQRVFSGMASARDTS